MPRAKLKATSIRTATMTYREPLPDDYPPDEAEEIGFPRVVYRLVRNHPAHRRRLPVAAGRKAGPCLS